MRNTRAWTQASSAFRQWDWRATFLASLLLSFILIGSSSGAWFNNVDDHLQLARLGPDREAHWREYPMLLWNSEFRQFGTWGHYRPVYYALQTLEAVAFDDDVHLWYGLRLLYLAIFSTVCFELARAALGWLPALALVVAVLNMHFWTDVFGRSLGVPETYAVPWFSLMIAGFGVALHRIAQGERAKLDGPLVAAAIGMAMAAGCKMNFVFSAAPVAMLLGFALWQRRVRWPAIAITVASFALPILVASSVLVYTARSGTDSYGMEVSFGSRLGNLRDAAAPALPHAVVLMLLLIGAWFVVAPGRRRLVALTAIVLLFGGAWLCWEVVFYGGRWPQPNNGRYSFPGLLCIPLAAGAVIFLARLGLERWPRLEKAATGLSALVVIWLALPLAFPVRAAASALVDRTQTFKAELDLAARMFEEHPDWPVIVEKAGSDEPELPLSFRIWLPVANPTFLRMHPVVNAGPQTAYRQEWWRILVETAENGTRGFRPIGTLAHPPGECFSVSWYGPYPSECVGVVLLRLTPRMVWTEAGKLVRAE